jgi:lipopolysaccharide transport system permease protein
MWAVLQPLALMVVYTAIFSRLAKVRTDGAAYPIFAFTALLPWVFFSSSITNATTGLVKHSPLVTKVYFPREIIPLSYISAAMVDFGIASVLLGGLMAYYRIALTWNALYALPIMGILTVFTISVALFLSAVQVRLRDVGIAMPLILQIWVFLTPIAYPLESVPPAIRRFYLLNPVAVVIESFRRAVLYGAHPDFRLLGVAALITAFTFLLAYGIFKVLEATMADYI